MPGFWERIAWMLVAALMFLGMAWIVERARWAFWKSAIQQSGRCDYAGCLCPCHGPVEANLSAKEIDLMEGEFHPREEKSP